MTPDSIPIPARFVNRSADGAQLRGRIGRGVSLPALQSDDRPQDARGAVPCDAHDDRIISGIIAGLIVIKTNRGKSNMFFC